MKNLTQKVILGLFLGLFVFGEVVRLKKIKVVEEEYQLLTKRKPIDFTAEGPINLKIESYILYPDTLKKQERYSLILETEEGEKFYPFQVNPSRVKDEKGRRYGQRRVVNFSLPSGKHHFRFSLFSSSKETCAVKITLEKIKWEEIKPIVAKSEVLVKKNGDLRYYETPVKINLKGGDYKILARLFYPEKKGEETLRISVEKEEESKREEKESVVALSPKVKTANQEMVSWVKAFYFSLEKGSYRIDLKGKRGMVKVYEKK